MLPVCNGDATVDCALASLRDQTLTNWELIAVDDGSSDGTLALLEQFARDDGRCRIVTGEHTGLVAALNVGLQLSRGKWIARMDADDEMRPERLAEQAAFLGAPENHAIGVVGCRVEFGGDAVAHEGYALHVEWLNSLITPEELALNRFIESPLAHPSVMFRRELIERHGGYREGDFPEDYELWLRWCAAGVAMAKVPRVLLRWNDHPSRLSRVAPRYGPEAFFRMKAEWVAREVRRVLDGPDGGARGRRGVWIWGAGRTARKRAAHLERFGVFLVGYVDVDPKKIGQRVGGTKVLSPDELPPPGEIFILGYVARRGARAWIRAALHARGYVEGGDFLMCA